jgi:hypothetical protein
MLAYSSSSDGQLSSGDHIETTVRSIPSSIGSISSVVNLQIVDESSRISDAPRH